MSSLGGISSFGGWAPQPATAGTASKSPETPSPAPLWAPTSMQLSRTQRRDVPDASEPGAVIGVDGFTATAAAERSFSAMDAGASMYDAYSGARPVSRIPTAGEASDAMATSPQGASHASERAKAPPHAGASDTPTEALPYGFDRTRVEQLLDGILDKRAGLASLRSTRQAGDQPAMRDAGEKKEPVGMEEVMTAYMSA